MLRLGYNEADGSAFGAEGSGAAFGAGGAIFGAAAGAAAPPPQAPHASQATGAGEAQQLQVLQQHRLQTNRLLITFNTVRIG